MNTQFRDLDGGLKGSWSQADITEVSSVFFVWVLSSPSLKLLAENATAAPRETNETSGYAHE